MSDCIQSIADIESKWSSSCNESVNVIVAGAQGSGKTSLVNALCGLQLDENGVSTNRDSKITLPTTCFIEKRNITVYDTCGIYEQSHFKHELAIRKIQGIKCLSKNMPKVLLYTVPIRSGNPDLDDQCLKKFTETFRDIWDHAIIVLTFVNEGQIDRETLGIWWLPF